MRRTSLFCAAVLVALASYAEETTSPTGTNSVEAIDLAGALRLAGARNLDLQISRERLAEAQAKAESTLWNFFPWISPGVTYRRHDNLIQDVAGNVIDVHKESYAVGPSLNAQVDLGDAIYKNLAARRLADAQKLAVEGSRADTLLSVAHAYFNLLGAEANANIASEALRITEDYLRQVREAGEAGVAFRGDVLRVQAESDRNKVNLRSATEQQQVASARLVQLLRLSPALRLAPSSRELAPMMLFSTNSDLAPLLARARASRPELKQGEFLLKAAGTKKDGAVYGPLIPTIAGQAFWGGLGGGRDVPGYRFGESEDYQVGLSWRIGPGGLFDRGRARVAEAQRRTAGLELLRVSDEIDREVVEFHARAQSLSDQLAFAGNAADAAEQALRLSRERQTFAVGNVLETIVAEQELTRARLDLSGIITEFNKAQYSLAHAVGQLDAPQSPEERKRDDREHLSH